MKILQIIYSLSSGGAECFVVDLSNELVKQGHEVSLCILNDDRVGTNGFYINELSKDVRYVSLKLKEGFSLSKIFSLYTLIKQIKPEIIHCHHNLINYIFPISIFLTKIKYFHTIHNDAPKEVGNKIEYYLRKIFYSTQKIKAITISNETSKSFVKYYKTLKFTEIYNGRKVPLPSREFENVKDFISNLRIDNEYIFLHVGRCAPQKNQEMLIRVFNRLINEGKSIALIIIGDGFESPIGIELKSISNNKILFLGQRHNVADYFINADAFCLSSIHEGMPITLIESLSCHCIPICTPVGGIIDTIQNGYNGFLSDSFSEEDYYLSIISYFDQKNTITKENLINTYESKFSIEECANKHIQLYGQ